MKIIFVLFALFIFSCSEDKFTTNPQKIDLEIVDITHEVYANYLHLHEHILIENKWTYFDVLDGCCLENHYWIIDGHVSHDSRIKIGEPGASYGTHYVELVLKDIYGDSVTYGKTIRVNEPLRVTLHSPIDGYDIFSDTIVFEYKVKGVNTWEQVSASVYLSANEDSLWNDENILTDKDNRPTNIWLPLHDETMYFWGVKAKSYSNESKNRDTIYDSATSEKRHLWLK